MKDKINFRLIPAILIQLFFILPNLFSQQTTLVGNYIKLSVYNENAKFSLHGRNSKDDKWIPLLFEDYPPTTYFRFFKDKKMIPFGEGGRGNNSEIKIIGKDIVYFWKSEDIRIGLKFALLNSLNSPNADSLLIEITLQNLTDEDYKVDILLCLDTYLGDKTKNHFLINENTIIIGEKEFKTINFPFIKSFDKELKIGLNLLFNNDLLNIPNRIYFTNWKRGDSVGKYRVSDGRVFDLKPYSINDSAIFAEYDDILIKGGDSTNHFIGLSMNNNISIDRTNDSVTTTTASVSTTTTIPTTTTTIQQENYITTTLSPTTTTTIASTQNITTTTTLRADFSRLDLANLNLSELLKLLNDINTKLIPDSNLTQEDIDFIDKVLNEIKSRRE